MSKNNKILLVLTGGTICSFEDNSGRRHTNAIKTKIENCVTGVDFVKKIPYDILSENLTVDKWNTLILNLKAYKFEQYKGVIILHGTDTLAYTSCLLSILLSGVKVPVFLVSSQLPLEHIDANGYDNFKTAVDLINKNIIPNVYVPYKNSDGNMYVHLGSRITQCPNHSNDFTSIDGNISVGCNAHLRLFEQKISIKPSVLNLKPYVGLDYSFLKLRNVKAVVHGTYHSQTVCIDCTNIKYSVNYLLNKGITVILHPCNKGIYDSTVNAIEKGVVPLFGMTEEMVYIKTLIGVSLGLKNQNLIDFLNLNINNEFCYQEELL